jgi:hypothetical protein
MLMPAQIRQGSLPVSPGLVDHLVGWIEPDDPRTQFGAKLGAMPNADATSAAAVNAPRPRYIP